MLQDCALLGSCQTCAMIFLTEQLLKIRDEIAVCARTVSTPEEINNVHVKQIKD